MQYNKMFLLEASSVYFTFELSISFKIYQVLQTVCKHIFDPRKALSFH